MSCVKASRFLFGYELRNPAEMERNSKLRNEIQNIIRWCEENTSAFAGGKSDDPHAESAKPPRIKLSTPSASPKSDATEVKCDIYGRVATAQALANQANSCGNKGVRWNTDYVPHYQWCEKTAANNLQFETRERQKRLDMCHKKTVKEGKLLYKQLDHKAQ